MAIDFVDYYQLLELNIVSSFEALKSSYKRLSIKHHPDNGGDQERFSLLSEAYQTLANDVSRRAYLEKWKQNKFGYNNFCKYPIGNSYEDIALQPVRESVHEYMFYIMNKEYEKAYHMLSHESSQQIFKKDFIKWQELIGEVHEILSFESAFETITYDDRDGVHVVFQVRVREHNMLLNRQEEDFFERVLVFENHIWKVQLANINIRQIIKKYKQIIEINRKSSKKAGKKRSLKYYTRYLDFDSFTQNIEYEFLRYKRYDRPFAIISILFEHLSFREQKKIIKIIEINTRITDSYTVTKNDQVILLLPETDNKGKESVLVKLESCLEANGNNLKKVDSIISCQSCDSSKELLNKVIHSE